MTEAQVLALINSFIVANGNNEITANVLRPILVAILEQPNDKVGELSTLSTTDKSNIVNAINEVLNEANSGFKIHAGTADPNVTPPATYAIGDWYIRNGVSLYQYNGSTWVLLSDSSQDLPTHYKGNFDATAVSPALSNATGIVGDEYKVINGGVNVDFGAGNVFLETDDIIIFYDSQWRLKVSPGIPKSEKGAVNGVATLDANGKLTASELPDLAITDVIVAVETTIALFATNSGSYVFQQGDVIILDNGDGGFYMYKGGTKTDVASYSEISKSEVDWSQVVNTPTTIGGYGITDFNSLGDARWLGLSGKAADSNLLDGVDSSQFLRSDVADQKTSGDLLFYNDVEAEFGNTNPMGISGNDTINTIRLASKDLQINDNVTQRFLFSRSSGNFMATGNIGVGDAPTSALHIKKSLPIFQIEDTATPTSWRFSVNSGNLHIDPISSSNRNIFLNNSGAGVVNVGIGNTSPSSTLDVSGTGRFTSTVTATNFILSSDIRLKKKIKDIGSIWRSFFMDGKKRYGVIAQEVEVENPELVYEDEKGFKSVAYIDLLCKKMAEKDKQIDSLEKRISKLEKLL